MGEKIVDYVRLCICHQTTKAIAFQRSRRGLSAVIPKGSLHIQLSEQSLALCLVLR
ncbi:hypothetical protein N803_15210 [Knoellia subterranea KCTC 19937]|uniref:Uncharacterized protein n=1 Tax=Knoellia subterranea KCTC 19937 TaxID=1385521 RepID=A0A0A0JMK2_9MICO|nr:hypothetical protein N803_15210 [Knoellia subterranea KCTC 19937]